MITTRTNFPTPAKKPRASSSAAKSPAWVAVRIIATDGRASRAATPSRRARARIHVHRRLVENNLAPADRQALFNPAPSRQHHQRQAVLVPHLRFSLDCTANSGHSQTSTVRYPHR
jgi:hypothetical protein